MHSKLRLNFRRAPVWLEAQRPLEQWYASSLGQSILNELESRLSFRLRDVFGYQGLLIGNFAPEREMLLNAGLHRRLIIDAPGGKADICADALHLPIASDTMKLVVLWHTLDFCDNPHQALREADRVLTDDGQLVIIGFNPISAFGLRHLLTGWRKRSPWHGRFFSRWRVKDWLSVLDYNVMHSKASFIRPPVNSEPLLRRLKWLERFQPWLGGLGGVYIVQAKKQTIPMTLARRQWRRKRSGVAVGPVTGNAEHARSRANMSDSNKSKQ